MWTVVSSSGGRFNIRIHIRQYYKRLIVRSTMYSFPVAFQFDRHLDCTATTCQISKRREHLRVNVLYWNMGCFVCLNPDIKFHKTLDGVYYQRLKCIITRQYEIFCSWQFSSYVNYHPIWYLCTVMLLIPGMIIKINFKQRIWIAKRKSV